MRRSCLLATLELLLVLASVHAKDYQVLKGDSLSAIATKNHVSMDSVRRANPSVDWAKLRVGTAVVIPDVYTVKPGDTLYSLARNWGLEQSVLLEFNGISSPSLKVGQVLYLPVSAAKTSPHAAVPTVTDGPFWPVSVKPEPSNDRFHSVRFATTGESFASVSSGVVVYLGDFRGIGRVLFVQRTDGTVFAYGNFDSAEVGFGQSVIRGQVLGKSSSRENQKLTLFAFRGSKNLDIFTLLR